MIEVVLNDRLGKKFRIKCKYVCVLVVVGMCRTPPAQ